MTDFYVNVFVPVIVPIISSVFGGIVGGLFTFLGVRYTIKHDDRQKQKEEMKKAYDERPRLEIKGFKDIKNVSSKAKFDCDFVLTRYEKIYMEDNCVLFSYDERIGNLKNLCCVEYQFANTGKTEIDDVCLICNYKEYLSLLPLKAVNFYLQRKIPEYIIWTEKRPIKPGDSLTVRVCYLNDKIIPFKISALVSIHMRDINGIMWRQPLFCPSGETDNSRMESFERYHEEKDFKPIAEHLRKILKDK